jgi:drug/metabolite transporter (DMT)-like permease
VTPRIALLLVSALWGTTFVLVKSGLQDASPLLFVGLRFAVATAASAALFRKSAAPRGAVLRAIPLGLVLACAYVSQTIGLSTTSPARSAFVTALNVAIVPLWAALFLRHRPSPFALVGLAVTLVGLLLLTSPEGGAWRPGDTWTLACAVLFALHVVLLSRWGAAWPAAGLLLVQLAVTAAIALSLTPLETVRFAATPSLLLAIGITAIFATAGTTWLQLRYQPRADPLEAALLYATEPIFAAIFSWMVLGETLAGWALLGCGLIVAGAVLATLPASAPQSAPPRTPENARSRSPRSGSVTPDEP